MRRPFQSALPQLVTAGRRDRLPLRLALRSACRLAIPIIMGPF
jgi:hypothetical protein